MTIVEASTICAYHSANNVCSIGDAVYLNNRAGEWSLFFTYSDFRIGCSIWLSRKFSHLNLTGKMSISFLFELHSNWEEFCATLEKLLRIATILVCVGGCAILSLFNMRVAESRCWIHGGLFPWNQRSSKRGNTNKMKIKLHSSNWSYQSEYQVNWWQDGCLQDIWQFFLGFPYIRIRESQ